MKIKISFTVEVDPEKWACEFSLPREEVRKDVQTYLESMCDEYIHSLGLGTEE